MLTLTLRVTQKHAFFVHQIFTPFFYLESLFQNVSYAKRKVWAMLKKERKEKYPYQKGMREKKESMPKSMKKRKERKKRNKDSPYYQKKGIHSKR